MSLAVAALTLNITMHGIGASTQLQDIFTGPIAKGLSLVAVVIGALMFLQSGSRGKKVWACLLFGLGMTVLIANFLGWIFGR